MTTCLSIRAPRWINFLMKNSKVIFIVMFYDCSINTETIHNQINSGSRTKQYKGKRESE